MLPNSTERTVTVAGTADAVTKCIYQICCVMLECPPKGATIPYRPKPAMPPVIFAGGQAYTVQGSYAIPHPDVSIATCCQVLLAFLFSPTFRPQLPKISPLTPCQRQRCVPHKSQCVCVCVCVFMCVCVCVSYRVFRGRRRFDRHLHFDVATNESLLLSTVSCITHDGLIVSCAYAACPSHRWRMPSVASVHRSLDCVPRP